jgi:hypothetical protein
MFQAVWYRAAIMALCWPATPSEVEFAVDSCWREMDSNFLALGTETQRPVARSLQDSISLGITARKYFMAAPVIAPVQTAAVIPIAQTPCNRHVVNGV